MGLIVVGNREAEIKTAIDSVTGKRMVGWFYADIWLAPRDDPDRALRALRTLSAFLDERHVI